jgi:hypothetical protein
LMDLRCVGNPFDEGAPTTLDALRAYASSGRRTKGKCEGGEGEGEM